MIFEFGNGHLCCRRQRRAGSSTRIFLVLAVQERPLDDLRYRFDWSDPSLSSDYPEFHVMLPRCQSNAWSDMKLTREIVVDLSHELFSDTRSLAHCNMCAPPLREDIKLSYGVSEGVIKLRSQKEAEMKCVRMYTKEQIGIQAGVSMERFPR